MKNLFIVSLLLGFWGIMSWPEQPKNSMSETAKTPAVKGSWLLLEKNGEELPVGMNVVMIVTGTYTARTGYDRVSRKFYYTAGGPYQLDKNRFTLTYEFNT